MIGVNHLGHFYLSRLLLDPVLIPCKARVINISSLLHQSAGSYANFDTLLTTAIKDKEFMGSQKHSYAPVYNYGISKASNILFARELNRLYKDNGIVSVSVHPGVIQETALQRHMTMNSMKGMLPSMIDGLWTPFLIIDFKNTKQGAATTLRCATLDDNEIIGVYVDKLKANLRAKEYFDGMEEYECGDVGGTIEKSHFELVNGLFVGYHHSLNDGYTKHGGVITIHKIWVQEQPILH